LRARRANDPDFRDRERARRYGITLAQLREMQARQNNACAICQRIDCELVLDHDHVTGELRGLLCIPCNFILGLLRDDPRIARAAAEYLERARGRASAGAGLQTEAACPGRSAADRPHAEEGAQRPSRSMRPPSSFETLAIARRRRA
jgi:hypothetical protein